MLAVAFTEFAGWKPGLVLLKWILGLSLTFPSLGRVVYSSQLKANTQLPVGTKSSSCGTASCKCWVQRFHEGPLTKKISIFIKLEKKKNINSDFLKMFLGEVVGSSVALRWLDHGNYFEWQQYYIHQYHDSKAVNNCIGHETVHSGNKPNHNLNLIKF